MNEIVKIKIGQETLELEQSQDILMADDRMEKELGACIQNLKKQRNEILCDLELFGDQLVHLNYDNLDRFSQHINSATQLDINEKDEITESIGEIDNFL
ncbi:UNKNOWN [Stylonychia lemnae]|uniref:Uncharacterized protein n=1 Tax=Stylonychia lemnae TaxID=5949 RepID=A0A078AQF4_STYLE|nr:UNKNOWN [Stylonychia lemnae]|eukprot:CDW84660.1 UNKNOWN [Stylonychia lemnae]